MRYAEKAFREDDREGLYIVAASFYLSQAGLLPDDIHVVPREQAEEFLSISAAQAYSPALTLIDWLQKEGQWDF